MVSGSVERVSQRDKGYSLLVGGDWYSGFGQSPVAEGEFVELEFTLGKSGSQGKPFKNISRITIKNPAPGQKMLESEGGYAPSSREKAISRQVAFKGAVELAKICFQGEPAKKEEVWATTKWLFEQAVKELD